MIGDVRKGVSQDRAAVGIERNPGSRCMGNRGGRRSRGHAPGRDAMSVAAPERLPRPMTESARAGHGIAAGHHADGADGSAAGAPVGP